MDDYQGIVDLLAEDLNGGPLTKNRALSSALRRRASTSLPSSAQSPVEKAPGSNDWYERGIEVMDRPADYSSAVASQQQNRDSASKAMMLALAASEAGPEFKPMAQHHLGQARVDPMKMAGATVDAQGNVVVDPEFQRTREAETFFKRGDQQSRQEAAQAEGARRAADRAEDRALRATIAGSRPPPQEPMVQAVDPSTGDVVYVPRSQAAGMRPPPKAGGAGTVNPEQQRKDAQEVVNLLDEAEKLLPKATSSGMGKARDATGAFFGASTEGAEAAASLKALGGLLVAKMPKMTGPQSDRDVLLYREMAGQVANEALPVNTRMAALKTVREINKRYADVGQGAPVTPSAGGSGSWSPPGGQPANQWSIKRVN